MARGLNKVMLIGRIQPNDPELRYTASGQAVCNFKLVTDESYKDKEGVLHERSEWHTIVAWGKQGEIIAQYMKKGSQIYIEGSLRSRKYEDKDGITRYVTEIYSDDFSFLDSRGPQGEGATSGGGPREGGGSYAGASAQPTAAGGTMDDDLPF